MMERNITNIDLMERDAEDDEEAAFGKSIGFTLRRFSAKNKATSKVIITQVLYDVEFCESSTPTYPSPAQVTDNPKNAPKVSSSKPRVAKQHTGSKKTAQLAVITQLKPQVIGHHESPIVTYSHPALMTQSSVTHNMSYPSELKTQYKAL